MIYLEYTNQNIAPKQADNSFQYHVYLKKTFEKPENKRQMYLGRLTAIHLSLIFGFFKCLPFRVCLAYSSETWLYYF